MVTTTAEFRAIIDKKPLLLDGATGTELEKRGVDITGKLWAGKAVIHNQKEIEDVYLNYLESGSDLIETDTYQISTPALKELGLDPHHTYQMAIDAAVHAQQQFLKQKGKKAFVVGSIGPYGAYLEDGSEFTGHYGEIDDDKLRAFHKDRLEYLYHSKDVDVIGIETIPYYDEIKVLLEVMKELAASSEGPAKPYYISLSCSDEFLLVDGTSLHEILGYINSHIDENLVAVGSNCCRLKTSFVLIEKFDLEFGNFPALDKQCKIVIYPNSGEVYNGHTKKWAIDDTLFGGNLQEAFGKAADAFVAKRRLGLVGGCCRTGPPEIRSIRKRIDDKYK